MRVEGNRHGPGIDLGSRRLDRLVRRTRGRLGRRIYARRAVVEGTQMRLNGIGLRTFSVLGIRIYVAGLYLERRNGDPDNHEADRTGHGRYPTGYVG
jgi:hypothetical protein